MHQTHNNATKSTLLETAAPRLMLLGVSIVMIAFALKGVPIAAAVALVALGGVAAVRKLSSVVIALVVYAPLGVFAVAAELHIAMNAASLAWRLCLAADAALAIVLLLMMVRYAGERLARATS
ncbi:hypothetical protein [Adhaeretor mobilis]|uniref:Uncharacterized protein n=1 Tax=Adhaeretor mobilis TaxID=1930276 RepID=A0A517MQK3_9BACT|nr:hypothetical protein [Adhaeretor mobilis]QDS97170.1 hypothetical protein HG15A2_04300 [Adhaeretor mobilis]